jgi:hypothetical protein
VAAVLICGDGIAASCCLRLLRHAGLGVAIDALRRPKLPAVMLSETTQHLLRDVFDREDLLAGFPRIRRRVVAWGPGGEPRVLPHSAIVLSEKELLDRIQQKLGPGEETKFDQPDWTVFASNPLPPSCVDYHFGSRLAAASAVVFQRGCDLEACWIESLESGWLFLLPSGEDSGWLLSVGDSAESLLLGSRLIKNQIRELRPSRGTFPSHPKIALPLSGLGWLACGTAAVGFDPLCGDGVGNAIREAILVSAVIRAVAGGSDPDNVVAHYEARLLSGFRRHIALCLEFYKSGRSGHWWDRQVNELERGLAWCSYQLAQSDASRYRLNGFTLEPVE